MTVTAQPSSCLRIIIDKLHMMADALMKYETIDSHQITDIMGGQEPRPPKGWDDKGHGGGASPVSDSETPDACRQLKMMVVAG